MSATPKAVTPDTPADGPAPHAPPCGPDACLHLAGIDTAAGPSSAIHAYSRDMAGAVWNLMLAPYLAMWTAFGARLETLTPSAQASVAGSPAAVAPEQPQ